MPFLNPDQQKKVEPVLIPIKCALSVGVGVIGYQLAGGQPLFVEGVEQAPLLTTVPAWLAGIGVTVLAYRGMS